ncbi:hypothetical protein JI735_34685 (plasmid) [Paenibacillus sonchi]|uniref:Helix-turn-helix domain-containing protein n=1 Tax=Paenibacillus sonchi TaxID=373687 RepID=A0A974PII6_9BACL|nr:hypothetical protein [Paenibacillus sonchi]QQZ64577.1 hypothetical protein JI735_34685 [Paenibacillus sonchi]
MIKNEPAAKSSLLSDLKGILDTAELKTYEKMIMVVIKVYQAEYGNAFPDYDTIAAAGGMCKRKAQYVVKHLADRDLIDVKQRFKDMPDGSKKQTSNQYLSQDPEINNNKKMHPVHASDAPNKKVYAQDAPYKKGFEHLDSFKSYTSTELKIKIEDEESRMREREPHQYACYADVYEKMIIQQGTGVLCFHQEEFLNCCLQFGLPHSMVSEIYKHVDIAIQKYHFNSIYRTFVKFSEGLLKKQIVNPIAWFVTTFRNEDLKVRTELQMEHTRFVS